MSKVALITNIPAPYRVDLFYYMQTNIKEHEFHVIYTRENEDNRSWKIKKEKMINSHILHSRVIKLKGRVDTRYIHIPSDVGVKLSMVNPDVVIAWEYNPAALQALMWCRYHKKKFIHLTDGTLFSERNIGKIQKLTRRIIIKNCNAAIASSTKAKEKLIAWGAADKKVFISLLTVDIEPYIKNNLEIDIMQNADKNIKIMLYVGRVSYRKGIDLLFSALQYIETDYSLHIVGDGDKKAVEEFKMQARKLGVLERICFQGFKSGKDLVEEYKKATLFVLPAREDCFGLVLLEAMCSLKPIVTSKYADGAYDMIKDGENGYIVDSYNAKEMGEALNSVLTDKSLQENCLRVSAEMRKKFTFEEVAKGYLQALNYVLHE